MPAHPVDHPPHISGPPSDGDRYGAVATAIDFLVENFDRQPGLEETADIVGLSPTHFQRVFTKGAGISPKRFLQALAAGEARKAMATGASVFEAALSAGLSGPSRLHDLFLVSEAMTPGAYRRKGEGQIVHYAKTRGPFGSTLIGATNKGVCWLSFDDGDDFDRSVSEMKQDWPAAEFREDATFIAPIAEQAFALATGRKPASPIGLYVQGTNFQLKVWEALLRIPYGTCVTYGDIARVVGDPKASRAVGTAVGANMISVLIPCHRVILSSGKAHNYRWGAARKKAILAMETAICENAVEAFPTPR